LRGVGVSIEGSRDPMRYVLGVDQPTQPADPAQSDSEADVDRAAVRPDGSSAVVETEAIKVPKA
jgi:hypothetical protein